MISEERQAELVEQLRNGVIEFDEDIVIEAANAVVAEGGDVTRAVFDGLVSGMQEVGDLYEKQEYFVPEMLLCADALYAGLDILKPHMPKVDGQKKGVVVIGTVQGDVHDIGKNIVKIMFDVGGFDVIDLGRDVPLEKFVEEQLNSNADLVCLSALMTTSMMGMKDVIEMLRAKNPNCKVMVGGAPLTPDIAEKFGADGYAKDANNALKEALAMITALKEIAASE